MVSSSASTVKDYLASLPPDRRSVIAAVRDLVNKNLPPGYQEGMLYGMIGWCVPLSRYADTYNGQPLSIVGLAAQKNYLTIYLMAVYSEPSFAAEFESRWKAAGKKLDMGKSCLRFQRLDDLALDVLADVVGRVGVDEYVARYQAIRGSARQQRRAAETTAAKSATKTTKTIAAKSTTKEAAKATAAKSTKKTAAKTTAAKSTKKKTTKSTAKSAKTTASKSTKKTATKSTAKAAATKTKSATTTATKSTKKSAKTNASKSTKKSTKTTATKSTKKPAKTTAVKKSKPAGEAQPRKTAKKLAAKAGT